MKHPHRASDFDPLLPESFDSPYPVYAELREHHPVAWSNAWGGFWALMKHADVTRAASDYRTFINSVQNVVPKVAFTGRRPPLHLDPPDHTPYRAALNPLLSERKVAVLEPVIRRICRELLQPMIDAGRGNLCDDFSSRMPVHVFAEWMRIPQDMVKFYHQTHDNYDIVNKTSLANALKIAVAYLQLFK